jgi:hypothetical protein
MADQNEVADATGATRNDPRPPPAAAAALHQTAISISMNLVPVSAEPLIQENAFSGVSTKVPKWHSIPIYKDRAHRNRQRLPSSLLIENVSAINTTASSRRFCAVTFPMKANDEPLDKI